MSELTKSPEYRPFRVQAADAEDLAVISAMLQDAAVPVVDLAYIPGENRLAFVASRYLWERSEGGEAPGNRVRCGVVISHVVKAQLKNLDIADKEKILALLAVAYGKGEDGVLDEVRLIFSGEAEIRLLVESLTVQAEDYGDPWPTLFKPGHPAAAEG
ncbi:MAG: DUF2948 family protein [Alphaproteobacteria bacterium]|nr:DUF2948 family protein [Alphaproteobacteria bacterium]